MKKYLLSVLFFFFFSLIYSQNKTRIGIVSGANYSSIRNTPLDNPDSDFGYLLGVSFEFYLKNNLSIKTGFSFEKRSTILDVNSFKVSDKYSYITVPLLLKINFKDLKGVFVNGGFFGGYILNRFFGKQEILSDNNKRIDFGVSFGVGKEFRFSAKNIIGFELRNNYGLLNIRDNEVNRARGREDVFSKTNSINLIVSWNFEL